MKTQTNKHIKKERKKGRTNKERNGEKIHKERKKKETTK